jgi:hypothetical protein
MNHKQIHPASSKNSKHYLKISHCKLSKNPKIKYSTHNLNFKKQIINHLFFFGNEIGLRNSNERFCKEVNRKKIMYHSNCKVY